MIKAFCTLITIFLPIIIFAQTEATYKVCDHRIFTKVETLPDFKNGITAFEDSLTQYLKKEDALPKKGTLTFEFIVTKQSQLLEFKIMEVSIQNVEIVKEALISLADMWIPAKQNSHIVCAYVYLKLEFSKNKLTAKVFE